MAGVWMTVSGVLFAAFDAESSTVTLVIGYVLFGLGFGFVNAPITNTAVSGMPRAQAGVAAAVASTSRQTGGTLGVAVIGAALASGIGSGPYKEVFAAAARPGWWIIAGCGLAVLVLGAVTTGGWARRTAERTAERLVDGDADATADGDRDRDGESEGASREGGGGKKGVRGTTGARTTR